MATSAAWHLSSLNLHWSSLGGLETLGYAFLQVSDPRVWGDTGAHGVDPGPYLWVTKTGCGRRGQNTLGGLVLTARLSCALSVPIPFRGDYVGLQGNPKLQKLRGRGEGPILVVDTVKKVNRGNGKVRSHRP